MSIDDTDTVDFISVDESGVVVLTISNHLNWESETLYKLQEKINCYLAFIESGAIFESYPNAKGKEMRISVFSKHQPNSDSEKMIGEFGSVVEGAGIGFVHEVSF